ncbi:MAG: hypothetical protein A3K19_17720 [Lentisphaerae bacterium RIFOXYB12_FULL_65_16]|nr:MAG: hypothetical protein A3K18_19120 [Lentisphaerae bacterium RIFOXYA12_64_32]OGV85281.1 MAG: hypothetical protein A3K19_17720 [Lentisphaerae bacterium RIFOXYB12_FULL_65_16]
MVWSPAYAPQAPSVQWYDSFTAALDAAAKDSRPILLHVLQSFDVSSVVIREWLMTEPRLVPALRGFHCVSVPADHAALKGKEYPRCAAAILGPDGALRAVVRDAPFRDEFVARFLETVADPRAPGELRAAALAQPQDVALVLKAADYSSSAGQLPEAVQVLSAAADTLKDAPAAVVVRNRLECYRAYAPGWVWSRFQSGMPVFEQFGQNKVDEKAFQAALDATRAAAQAMLDGEGFQAIGAALEGLQRAGEAPRPSDAYRAAFEALGGAVKAVGEQGLTDLRAFLDTGKGEPDDRTDACQTYLRQIMYAPEKEAEAVKFTRELIGRLTDEREFLALLPLLVEAVIQLDMENEHLQLAERVVHSAAHSPAAASGNLKLADRAVEQGDLPRAYQCWDAAEQAATGQCEALRRAACAARALVDASASPNRTRWARRKAADAVVLVPDAGAFLDALGRWTEDEFFPILFQDDAYAPRFIEAYQPKTVYLAPASGTAAVDLDVARRAVLAAWSAKGFAGVSAAASSDLVERLKELGEKPMGTVFVQPTAGEALGGIALAAGRFQGLEPIACPKNHTAQIGRAEIGELASQIRAGLALYDLPEADGRWAAITLAADVPFRCTGTEFPKWGSSGAVDDYLGRFDDSTRYAVVGRLLGDAPRAIYQAMCSLFLVPDRALFFNNYGTDPKTIWGWYRTAESAALFAKRMPTDEVHTPENTVAKFRALTTPWNRYGMMFINSSGGATSWSVGGGGGNTDDSPVGVSCAIHIIHSGSAADPYNPDTLAGRAIWGGAYWYFGSTAEPFLAAFQPVCNSVPRVLAGAPYAAIFRQRTDDRFWSPWRLMIVGDPLFCLRSEPVSRTEYQPAQGETRLELAPGGVDLVALRTAVRLGDGVAARQIVDAAGPAAPWLLNDGDALALAVTCLLRQEAYAQVTELFQAAAEEARKQPTARIGARAATAALFAKALEAKDVPALTKNLCDMGATGAPPDFILRHVRTALDGAPLKTNLEMCESFLDGLLAAPELAACKVKLELDRARGRVTAIVDKPALSAEDVGAALTALQAWLDLKPPEREIKDLLKKFKDAYLKKLPGATVEAFGDELRKLKAADPVQARVIGEFLRPAQ